METSKKRVIQCPPKSPSTSSPKKVAREYKHKQNRHGKRVKPLWKIKRAEKLKERQQKRSQEIAQLIEHRDKANKEKQLQMKAYKKKRLEKTKAINKKTRHGQPVMKGRIQLLLQQIKGMVKS